MCELHTVRLQELQAELDAIKRNNSYCPMCGAGTVPSKPAPAQEPAATDRAGVQ